MFRQCQRLRNESLFGAFFFANFRLPRPCAIEGAAFLPFQPISFAKELPANQRSIVTNSLLLAQLASDARVKDKAKLKDWYNTYFQTLGKLGWLVQCSGFTEHQKKGADFEVHEAIISVATAAFGPAATALKLVVTTLNAMKKMGDNAPWMTVFKRSSQSTKVARFQVTTAESAIDGGTMISMIAFELGTKNVLTQVLFFKFKSADVRLWHASGNVTLEKNRGGNTGTRDREKGRRLFSPECCGNSVRVMWRYSGSNLYESVSWVIKG